MKAQPIEARPREETGTRACLKLRRTGWIPASLYGAVKSDGGKTELHNHNLKLWAHDIVAMIEAQHALLEVKQGGEDQLVLIKEVQWDALGDDVLHVDLERVDAGQPLEVEVPLEFVGDARGVKQGGILTVEARKLGVRCKPREIPDVVTIRIDDLKINQSIQIKDVTLPEGVESTGVPEDVVVTIVAPRGMAVEEEAPAEGEGGEG